jgi:hypothetical protein
MYNEGPLRVPNACHWPQSYATSNDDFTTYFLQRLTAVNSTEQDPPREVSNHSAIQENPHLL